MSESTPAPPTRLALMMGTVWLLGVVFALLMVGAVISTERRTDAQFTAASRQAQHRLSDIWKRVERAFSTPSRSSSALRPPSFTPLVFNAKGSLVYPVHLATPTPPLGFVQVDTSKPWVAGANVRAQRRWQRAERARRAGRVANAIALYQQIPSQTFAANGVPLELLAAYRLWQVQAPQSAERLLHLLGQPTHPIAVREWLLQRILKDPALRSHAVSALRELKHQWKLWRHFSPPKAGRWRKQGLGKRAGVIVQTTDQRFAWIAKRALQDATQDARRSLGAVHIATRLSLQENDSVPRPPHKLTAGPLLLKLQRQDWLHNNLIIVLTGLSLLLCVLLLAGAAMWRLYQREQALTEQQRRLAAAVTHELRSPLTALSLTTELLASGEVPSARLPRHHERLHQQVKRLQGVIDNVIALYRRGHTNQALQRCDAAATVREVLDAIAPMAKKAGVLLELVEEAPPLTLPLGSHDLSRTLHNLIDNALRYAPQSDLQVKLGPGPQLHVIDSGPGLPQTLHKRIFAPFVQGPSSGDHRQGLGLGLSFVHDVVTRSQGTISISTTPGGGATFSLKWSPQDEP